MAKKRAPLPQGWTKTTDGAFARTDDKATAAEAGKRWIAVVDGNALEGEGGRARYFGTPDAAMNAADVALGGSAPAVEEPAPPAAAGVVRVDAKGKAPRATKEKPAAKAKPTAAPKVKASPAPRPVDAAGKRQAVPFADDDAWPAIASAHGFSYNGTSAKGRLGTLELSEGGGLWVPKTSAGEVLTSTATGKFRGFIKPSSALQALVDAAG